jgi:hypothetical protein
VVAVWWYVRVVAVEGEEERAIFRVSRILEVDYDPFFLGWHCVW